MLFMITWRGTPATRDTAIQRFLKGGGQPPPGVKMLGRWHAIGPIHGVAIAEADDAALLQKWALDWTDVFEMNVHAALDDEHMGPLLAAHATR